MARDRHVLPQIKTGLAIGCPFVLSFVVPGSSHLWDILAALSHAKGALMKPAPSQFNVLVVSGVLAFFAFEAADAATIRVPSDQPSIQGAIGVAVNGDTVLVAPGTYIENIDFLGKTITVQSQNGPNVTIIDGQKLAPVVSFINGETSDSKIIGFTLQNGHDGGNPSLGGGVAIIMSSPSVIGNIIKNNTACRGGGIQIFVGGTPTPFRPIIEENTISHNGVRCSGGGGSAGIDMFGNVAAEIRNNIISHNISNFVSSGGIFVNMSLPTFALETGITVIENNIISYNVNDTGFLVNGHAEGGGIAVINRADVMIIQNLIFGNIVNAVSPDGSVASQARGGGISWSAARIAPGSLINGPIVINNTIANNILIGNPKRGSGVFAGGFDELSVVENNVIVGEQGVSAFDCGDFNDFAPVHKNNDVFTPGGQAYSGFCFSQVQEGGNISVNPNFFDSSNDDFHLMPWSRVVDAGDNSAPELPAKDLDGRQRILDGDGDRRVIVDMGAYEVPIDIDGDGMANGFEISNGFDPFDSTDASEDADGDGATNLEEFLSGCDPLNPKSKPPCTNIVPVLELLLLD